MAMEGVKKALGVGADPLGSRWALAMGWLSQQFHNASPGRPWSWWVALGIVGLLLVLHGSHRQTIHA